MKKARKVKVAARKRWKIHPSTRVHKDKTKHKRTAKKQELQRVLEDELETE